MNGLSREKIFHSADKGESQEGERFSLLGNLTVLEEASTYRSFPMLVFLWTTGMVDSFSQGCGPQEPGERREKCGLFTRCDATWQHGAVQPWHGSILMTGKRTLGTQALTMANPQRSKHARDFPALRGPYRRCTVGSLPVLVRAGAQVGGARHSAPNTPSTQCSDVNVCWSTDGKAQTRSVAGTVGSEF